MTKIKVTLDKRDSNKTKEGKHPLVLRISHNTKTRDISFNIHLNTNQYNGATGKITGINQSVRHTKRVRKIYSDADLWIDENHNMIKKWEVARVKEKLEKLFFKKEVSLTLLSHAAVYLFRLRTEERYSTADSYEDALKIFVKYQKKLKRLDDTKTIVTLFDIEKDKMTLRNEFKELDIEIKAFDKLFAREFKAYMYGRFKSENTPRIHFRSLQAILNDAKESYEDLKNHEPLKGIEKQSLANEPNPLTAEEIDRLRALNLKPNSEIWHNRNYLLFMFNNRGINYFDLATIKRTQFINGRVVYYRRKTKRRKHSSFDIQQSPEALAILNYYMKHYPDDEYIFPIIPEGTKLDVLHKVNNLQSKEFNKYANYMADLAEIEKKITTYSIRDSWGNIGLDTGASIRDISSGLGHSSVLTTEKHYANKVKNDRLDELNRKITQTQYKITGLDYQKESA